MPLRDYSEDSDYYTQGFEKAGVVSIWVGVNDAFNDSEELDVLQDLCGVGYYELHNQESNCFDFQVVPLKQLLEEMSYSDSFLEKALSSALRKGIDKARWVTLQYDFNYDPKQVRRVVKNDPVFIGSFPYSE